MKKKLLVFIALIIFTMSFLLTVPKAKAQTNTRLVVQSYDVNAGTITFYDYDTQAFFGTFDFNNIYDNTNNPFITNKTNIPYIFRLGDVYELIDELSANLIQVKFVQPVDRQIFFTLNDMVDGQVYEYKGIVDNKYIFNQGFNFYQVPTTLEIYFHNRLDGVFDFQTILKPGNNYIYMVEGIDPSWVAAFWFVSSPDYEYTRGYMRGSEGEGIGYTEGYEAGSRLAEGLLESEYQRGLQNGFADGFREGRNKGFRDGYAEAYDEIITSDEYTLAYENGFKDGEKSKIAQNNQSFYSGIEKWLVPAIIVVIVLGGIFSIASFKRREA
jgi:hypothetical protein